MSVTLGKIDFFRQLAKSFNNHSCVCLQDLSDGKTLVTPPNGPYPATHTGEVYLRDLSAAQLEPLVKGLTKAQKLVDTMSPQNALAKFTEALALPKTDELQREVKNLMHIGNAARMLMNITRGNQLGRDTLTGRENQCVMQLKAQMEQFYNSLAEKVWRPIQSAIIRIVPALSQAAIQLKLLRPKVEFVGN